MSKISDVFAGFDDWMNNYNHPALPPGMSQSGKLKDFIHMGLIIVEWGVSYDEYVALALMAKDHNYSIDWIVSYETFSQLVAEAKRRRDEMHAEMRAER
jgi:hypothetical protein